MESHPDSTNWSRLVNYLVWDHNNKPYTRLGRIHFRKTVVPSSKCGIVPPKRHNEVAIVISSCRRTWLLSGWLLKITLVSIHSGIWFKVVMEKSSGWCMPVEIPNSHLDIWSTRAFKKRSSNMIVILEISAVDEMPTDDASCYRVRIWHESSFCTAFVFSMHLTDDKSPQLIKCLEFQSQLSSNME